MLFYDNQKTGLKSGDVMTIYFGKKGMKIRRGKKDLTISPDSDFQELLFETAHEAEVFGHCIAEATQLTGEQKTLADHIIITLKEPEAIGFGFLFYFLLLFSLSSLSMMSSSPSSSDGSSSPSASIVM